MTSLQYDLILLKGAPGVGKSTVAKLLAARCNTGVRLEVDTLRGMVIDVDWTNQKEHRSVLNLAGKLASGFLKAGFRPVIFVDTFSGDKLDEFMVTFQSEHPNGRIFVAVLSSSDDELRQRLLSRGDEGFRDVEVALQINQQAAQEHRPFGTRFDTTNRSPQDVTNAVLAAMGS